MAEFVRRRHLIGRVARGKIQFHFGAQHGTAAVGDRRHAQRIATVIIVKFDRDVRLAGVGDDLVAWRGRRSLVPTG